MHTKLLNIGASVSLAAAAALVVFPVYANTLAKNSDYIRGLNYDLDLLLSLDMRPTTKPSLDNERSAGGGGVSVCTKTLHDVDSNLSSNSLLNPSNGVVYPGALVKLNSELVEGKPVPISGGRSPVKLSIQLHGIGDDGVITVANPTNVEVPRAINNALNKWHNSAAAQEYSPVIQAYSEARKSYNKTQIGVELGMGAQWESNSVTGRLNVDATVSSTTTYQVFKQIYYSVVMENPSSPGSVFASDYQVGSRDFTDAGPPGYVRSVDYGRIIIVQMNTAEAVIKQEAEAALDLMTSGNVQVQASLKQRLENITKNSTFKVFIIGGGVPAKGETVNQEALTSLLSGDVSKMSGVIQRGLRFSKSNPAIPIQYQVVDLKTNAVASMRTTASYVEKNCTALENQSLKMVHQGGYVVRYTVLWQAWDANLNAFLPQIWTSGSAKKTAPWEHTLHFDGDAKGFSITAENDTWLAWDPHRTVSWNFSSLGGKKCVKVWGTTLNMGYGEC